MAVYHYELRTEIDGLNGCGIGVQHLPRYTHLSHDTRHTHDVVELNYVVQGNGTHYLGRETYATEPGSLGITHYTQAHELTTEACGMSVINIYLDLDKITLSGIGPELEGCLAQILPMHPSLRHRRNQFVHLRFTPSGREEQILWLMLDEQQRRVTGYRDVMQNLLRLFLIQCARNVRDHGLYADASVVRASDVKMEELRKMLDSRVIEPIALDALAARFGFTKHYLCRAFKRYTGTSMLTYRLRARINQAMTALRASNDGVLDIALSCGFTDQSFFNRKFKAMVGMTPKQYRQSASDDGEDRE
jgi:AraC family transcriptional regulator, L-rhamnose operon transcriptional activator RhaR